MGEGDESNGDLRKYVSVDKNHERTTVLLQNDQADYIVLEVEQFTLHLERASVYGDGACVGNQTNADDECNPPPNTAHHWWGIVAGAEDSLASCSISESEVACVI